MISRNLNKPCLNHCTETRKMKLKSCAALPFLMSSSEIPEKQWKHFSTRNTGQKLPSSEVFFYIGAGPIFSALLYLL